jgi:hypothetical protein
LGVSPPMRLPDPAATTMAMVDIAQRLARIRPFL